MLQAYRSRTVRNMPPRNSNIADFQAWKRRDNEARRLPPAEPSGLRDPDGRPRFDPAHVMPPTTAVAVLRDLWEYGNLTTDERAAVALAAQALEALTMRGAA